MKCVGAGQRTVSPRNASAARMRRNVVVDTPKRDDEHTFNNDVERLPERNKSEKVRGSSGINVRSRSSESNERCSLEDRARP